MARQPYLECLTGFRVASARLILLRHRSRPYFFCSKVHCNICGTDLSHKLGDECVDTERLCCFYRTCGSNSCTYPWHNASCAGEGN